jgi:hypothetical protein
MNKFGGAGALAGAKPAGAAGGKVVATNERTASMRRSPFLALINKEREFVAELDYFITAVIDPLQLRDTSFKKNFLGEPSISTSFVIMKNMHAACSKFLADVLSSSSAYSMATTFTHFAPSIQLFSQFAAENVAALNALKSYHKNLKTFLAGVNLAPGKSMETFMVLPVDHYQHYFTDLQVVILQ